MTSVLFVCLGNICRSPAAEGVFRKLVREAGLEERIEIESAGTGDWHVGHAPDHRMRAAALARGMDLSDLRARRVTPEDIERFDHVLAMDRENLSHLRRLAPPGQEDKPRLFLSYAGHLEVAEVPDPYYGGEDGFEHVLDLIEEAARHLLEEIRADR